jgi:hypothetical protein
MPSVNDANKLRFICEMCEKSKWKRPRPQRTHDTHEEKVAFYKTKEDEGRRRKMRLLTTESRPNLGAYAAK